MPASARREYRPDESLRVCSATRKLPIAHQARTRQRAVQPLGSHLESAERGAEVRQESLRIRLGCLCSGSAAGARAHLSVLCRTMAQVEAAAACAAADEIIIDFLELDGVMEALKTARCKRTVVATPRIIKPAEEALWRVLLELEGADAILVRSTDRCSRYPSSDGL